MIATLDQLRSALGLTDGSQDAALTIALAQAHGLLNSYIGFDLSDTAAIHEYVYTPDSTRYSFRMFVHLPYWPVLEVIEVLQENGNAVPSSNYKLIKGPGRVDFFSGLPGTDYLTFHYRAGYDPVPDELLPVVLNIASTIYNNGGVTGSTNALKSLTMFDAMSMSFETGDANSGNAQGLLDAWGFILGKYRITQKPVLK